MTELKKQTIDEVKELRKEFSSQAAATVHESRSAEVVIGGFRSKDVRAVQPSRDAIMDKVAALIRDAPGNPQVVFDRVGNVPQVVPGKFDSVTDAQNFVRKIPC